MNLAGSLLAEGKQHPLRHALSIGRGSENDIVLPRRTVSRRHATVTFVDGRWLISDHGSANGTFVNAVRVPFGSVYPLRHGDRIAIGAAALIFSWPAERDDPDRTDEHDAVPAGTPPLSPYQLQVVHALCGAWVSGDPVDAIPSNERIAAALGTPEAVDSVKAALRRIYSKAGLTALPSHVKRRALCRIARASNWV